MVSLDSSTETIVMVGSADEAAPSMGEEFEGPEVLVALADPGFCADPSGSWVSTARALPFPLSIASGRAVSVEAVG